MSTTPTRRTRVLAGLGAAVVTVGIIVAASLGYNAVQSDDEPDGSATPTISPTPSPTEQSPTQQAPPDDGDSTADDEPAEQPDEESGETGDEGDHGQDHGDTAPPEWKVVLDGFARDFNKVTGSKKKWQARMARWVTPHLADAYATVDPRMLPNTTIDETVIQSEGSEAVTAIIHYRGIQPVWVHLQPTPDGWRVTEAEPYTGD